VKLVLDKQHPHSLAGCPGLASSLAAAHHFDTLHAVLHGATDLTSGEIASVVRAIVTAPGPEAAAARRKYAARIRSTAAAAVEAAEKAADAGASNAGSLVAVAACAAGTVEGFSSWQLCLHPLVAMRHDPSVLLAALRELSAAHALALLRYMLQWLRNFRTIIADCHVVAADVSALEIPGPTTVIEWFSLILDASMARLALREESAAVLAEVQKEVAPQVAALRQLARVKGAVEHLQCGAPLPLPSQGAVGRYTMEWLSLRVAS